MGALLRPLATDLLAFNEALGVLRAYSLIHRDAIEKAMSVHRLVQAVVRDALPMEERNVWMQRAVFAVDTSFRNVEDVDQWDACERWLPHALVCVTWIEQEHRMDSF
jgi:hypothetical protein